MSRRIFERFLMPSFALISVLILAACLFAGGAAKADTSLNVTKIGALAGGLPREVFVLGNYAYVAAESALSVVDISNPSTPVQVGCAETWGYANSVYVTGGYVYVAAGSTGLLIMYNDPAAPIMIDYYDTPGDAQDVFVSGVYAYVADGDSGLRIIDVSNPASPYEIGFYENQDWFISVYVSGNYAYVVDNRYVLRIIDASDPASPIEVGYYDAPGTSTAKDVYVVGNYAYVVDDNYILRIIDVSNPAAPSEVGYYQMPWGANSVYVSGGYAYVEDVYFGRVHVIDVSNPAAPIEVGYFDTSISSQLVYVEGGYAYVADNQKGLQIIDVRFPSSPIVVGFHNMLGDSQGIYVTGGYAYVADGDSGLRIIDVSAPAAPIEVGYQEIVEPADVYVSDGYAYVAASDYFDSGLRIIDVSNPAAPIEVAYQEIEGATDVYVSGNYAYVADSGFFHPALRIIDVSNPAAPIEVGHQTMSGTVQDVFVAGNYAYVGTFSGLGSYWDGLRIVDISNPASPSEVGYYQMPWGANSVYVSGSYAYITDGYSGLRIINVSNPASPVEVGYYDTLGNAYGVYVSGGYAYVSVSDSHFSGLRIIDVSNPAAPIEVGYHRTPGAAAIGVFATGGYAYVSCDDCGYSIFQITGADTTLPVQSGWDPPKGGIINSMSPTISFNTNENAYCKWSLTDQDYADMLGDCEGDGSMSQQCDVTGLALGPNTVHIACKDAYGNQDTAETNQHIEYTVVDTTPPMQSAWDPAKDSLINTVSPSISFNTNENADCKWSLTDQDYADMLGDCEGDGSMSQQCDVTGLAQGANTVHIACQDAYGNQDTADTNEHIEYTVDASPPMQSAWDPAKGSMLNSATATVSFTTDENADCKWSLTDQSYADMLGDCEGDSSMSQQCYITGLVNGTNIVHIACQDMNGNQDTADTNEYVEYTVAASPPTDVSFVNDGDGEDIDTTTDSDRLSANWSSSSDPDSGISRYWYSIGTAIGGSDVADWTDNGTNTAVTRTGLSLELGRVYYFTVKAENGVGLFSNPVSSDGQLYMIEGDGLVVPPEEWTAVGSCKTSNVINVSSVFGAASAHFFSFESGKFQYMENPETVALQHGKGYFLISIGPSEVILPDTGNDYTEDSFVFTLDAGWNFISNPYCVPINAGQPNIAMTCGGAPQNDIDLYVYSGATPEKYVRVTMEAGFKILPRAAYFVKSAQSGCQLTITKD